MGLVGTAEGAEGVSEAEQDELVAAYLGSSSTSVVWLGAATLMGLGLGWAILRA